MAPYKPRTALTLVVVGTAGHLTGEQNEWLRCQARAETTVGHALTVVAADALDPCMRVLAHFATVLVEAPVREAIDAAIQKGQRVMVLAFGSDMETRRLVEHAHIRGVEVRRCA